MEEDYNRFSPTQVLPEKPVSEDAIKIFYSYSRKDLDMRNALEDHLSALREAGRISTWHDLELEAGTEWEPAILHKLDTADIILLLISSSFIASKYCYGTELKRAIARHNAGTARVIPIILRPCDWNHLDVPFSKLNVLPTHAKPIASWANQDEAFAIVAQRIRETVDQLNAKKQPKEQQSQQLLAQGAAGQKAEQERLKYRQVVEQKVNQGSFQVNQNRFSVPARKALDLLSHQLGIATDTTQTIEVEVTETLREYYRKLQEYERTIQDTLENEGYPLSESTRIALRDYQTLLNLQDEDVQKIEFNILYENDNASFEIDIDYRHLLDLLKAKKWQEADEKTYRIIIKVSQRTEQGYLDLEDIENFPCVDLQTIDRLWVRFSNGCFGLSIQKRVWKECNNHSPESKAWHECAESLNKFGEIVGWGEYHSWFSTREENLNLVPVVSLRSPLGHMPTSTLYLLYPMYRDEADQIHDFLDYFFARIETCKL